MKNFSSKSAAQKHWSAWMDEKGYVPSQFQKASWKAALDGKSGIISAPTGRGKTIAALAGCLMRCAVEPQENKKQGVKILWVTPLKALARNTTENIKSATQHFFPEWNVGFRTGDASARDKAAAVKGNIQLLVTTPESLAVLLTHRNASEIFQNLRSVIVDEWHELLGSKRGVLLELNLAQLRKTQSAITFWGLSATIGNLAEAAHTLIREQDPQDICVIQDERSKRFKMNLLVPQDGVRLPWAGHLGLSNLANVLELVLQSNSCIVFTNTRTQAELWYTALHSIWPLEPSALAMHHGSLDQEIREQVEAGLSSQRLRCVVATSSLELGVDFPHVDRVIQIGSPHSVARSMQRAGRAKHSPSSPAEITAVATQAMDFYEFLAIQELAKQRWIEPKEALQGCLDVLSQHVISCSLNEPCNLNVLLDQVRSTNAFHDLKTAQWDDLIEYLCTGGKALAQYPAYQKLQRVDQDHVLVQDAKTARLHRFNMGTIYSRSSVAIQFVRGGRIGSVDENFLSKLSPGDVFDFAGRSLELFKVEGMTAWVKLAKKRGGITPSWSGESLQFSYPLGFATKKIINSNAADLSFSAALQKYLHPIRALQSQRSLIPKDEELLIEEIVAVEKSHRKRQRMWCIYPFAGKTLHESMALIVAYRLSQLQPNTFNWSANHYGFMLASENEISIEPAFWESAFETKNLRQDMELALNLTEMVRRKFREIAQISGLVYGKSPVRSFTAKQMQVSSGLLYDVIQKYDPEHILLKEAKEQTLQQNLRIDELATVMDDMRSQKKIFSYPDSLTPFSFGLWAESLRGQLSNESWTERVKRFALKMQS